MRRTQLYLEDDIWNLLHALARQNRSTVSDLVRQAVREKYAGCTPGRAKAMIGVIGLWKDRDDLPSTEKYIRALRKGERLRRLAD